jgi:Flp pilus assembly protein TadG
MQLAADAAALAAAKELSLSDAKRDNVPSVVAAIVTR